MINLKSNNIQLTPMMRYLLYSVFVTVIDTIIVWILYHIFTVNIVVANSIGVISGFIIHYRLSSKAVFQTEFGITGFIIYLGTFFLGLLIADTLIYTGEQYLFTDVNVKLSFLFSKGISIIIPFFFLYFTRKILFNLLKRSQQVRKGIKD